MTCLLLCGGKSKRMGRAKEFLPLAGSTMLEHILDRASNLFSEVLLVTNSPEDFEHLSANIVKDIVPDRGPLVGILSGLLIAQHEFAMVLPSDMPLFDEEAIADLLSVHASALASQNFSAAPLAATATVYESENRSGLPGILSSSLIHLMEESIFGQQYSLSEFLSKVEHKLASSPHRDARPPWNFDVNTPMDYIRLVHG